MEDLGAQEVCPFHEWVLRSRSAPGTLSEPSVHWEVDFGGSGGHKLEPESRGDPLGDPETQGWGTGETERGVTGVGLELQGGRKPWPPSTASCPTLHGRAGHAGGGLRREASVGARPREGLLSPQRWPPRPSTGLLSEGHSGSREKQRDTQPPARAAESTWWPVGDMKDVTTSSNDTKMG